MRLFSGIFLLAALAAFSASGQNMGPFKIVSDTKKEVEGKIYKGSCEELSKKVEKEQSESLTGKFKNLVGVGGPKCEASKEVKIDAKKGSKRSEHDIGAGQWAIFFKTGMSAEGLVPAYCFADPSKPGKILLLQTPKSEKSRSVTGKSLGFGLKCTQVERIP